MIALSITEAGLVCSLGLGSEQACASARAGLARVTPVDALNTVVSPALAKEGLDGVPWLGAHQVPVIAKGFAGLGKLLVLAQAALTEVLVKAPAGTEARTGLCVCLADDHLMQQHGRPLDVAEPGPPPGDVGVLQQQALRLAQRLADAMGPVLSPAAVWASRAGRLGLLGALQQAATWLEQGVVDRCVICAADSFIEPDRLEAAARAQLIKTEANPVGFMPGEAGVCLLVEPDRGRAGLQVLGLAHAQDAPFDHPDQAPFGRGLAHVAAQALHQGGALRPALVVHDLNGTESRAMDWGHGQVHLRPRWCEQAVDAWLPAESFGETGAAVGLLALCMVLEAGRRQQVPGGAVLVLMSDDQGGRGAVVVQSHGPH